MALAQRFPHLFNRCTALCARNSQPRVNPCVPATTSSRSGVPLGSGDMDAGTFHTPVIQIDSTRFGLRRRDARRRIGVRYGTNPNTQKWVHSLAGLGGCPPSPRRHRPVCWWHACEGDVRPRRRFGLPAINALSHSVAVCSVAVRERADCAITSAQRAAGHCEVFSTRS